MLFSNRRLISTWLWELIANSSSFAYSLMIHTSTILWPLCQIQVYLQWWKRPCFPVVGGWGRGCTQAQISAVIQIFRRGEWWIPSKLTVNLKSALAQAAIISYCISVTYSPGPILRHLKDEGSPWADQTQTTVSCSVSFQCRPHRHAPKPLLRHRPYG